MVSPLLLSALILALPPIERGVTAFRPGPEESSVPELFRLEASRFLYEMEPVLATTNYTVARVRFPSPITTPDPENNVVHAEYFAPSVGGPKRPAVIVLHILGADFPLSRYMAARLADRGVAALFLKLPYYGERRPARRPEFQEVPVHGHRTDRDRHAPGHLRCPTRRLLAEQPP